MEKIGLIPAAGYARRLGKIQGSKEMIPVNGGYGIEPVCHSLIRQFENSGILKIVLVTRKEKVDLLHHLECNLNFNVEIETVILEQTTSTLESICATYELIRDKEVYLGFPDMMVSPVNAMSILLEAKSRSSSNVLLCALPAKDASKVDMIDIALNNSLVDLVIKDPDCCYKYTWIMACWMSNFTEYLYNLYRFGDFMDNDKEIYIGDVFLSYLKAGHDVHVQRLESGEYLDIGTPEDLASVRKLLRNI
jgi:glucose-1-phosphate thymidylyltransferase